LCGFGLTFLFFAFGVVWCGVVVVCGCRWPFCEQNNPHQGGEPTFYPSEVMNVLRDAFTGSSLPLAERQSTVIIKRGGSRALTNHQELVDALNRNFPRIKLEIFDDNFAHNRPFEDHVKLFSRAKVSDLLCPLPLSALLRRFVSCLS
jgi:hypothetical protein